MANKIGFIVGNESEAMLPDENMEDVLDLNEELARAINTLVGILHHYDGTIKGISISTDIKGNHKTQLKY